MGEQKLKNHGRYVPLYHFFTLPILIGNFGARVYFWIKAEFGLSHFFPILLAAALFLGVLYARLFALRVQDRLIRLEGTGALRAYIAERVALAGRRAVREPICFVAVCQRR